MTREEYEKTYIRMMDSIRDEYCKGGSNCKGVACHKCPLQGVCEQSSVTFSAFAVMEVVEQWGKEHPIVTKADKFEEVFGRRPRPTDYTAYVCPRRVGFDVHECHEASCITCAKAFWESEYVEPTIGRVTPDTQILNG